MQREYCTICPSLNYIVYYSLFHHFQGARANNEPGGDGGRDGAEAVARGDAAVGAPAAPPQGVPARQAPR